MIGQRVRRREDPRFLTGNGRYVDDLKLPGALHIAFVRSDLAHARIVRSDRIGDRIVEFDAGGNPQNANFVTDCIPGPRHIDMPADGERVWRAIQEARAR